MVARRSAVRTARHCDTALAPGSPGGDYPPTICARGGRLSRLGSTIPKIVPGAGHAHASLRCTPDAEDVTPCDSRVALYTPKATALVAPAVETLLDVDYYRRFRHARRPTRPVPNSSKEAGSGTAGSGSGKSGQT